MRSRSATILVNLLLVLLLVGPTVGQATDVPDSSGAQGQTQSGSDAQELAKKLSNPVASLISFPLQANFDFGMGTGSGWRYQLNIQPVLPADQRTAACASS